MNDNAEKEKISPLPTSQQVETEIKRLRYRRRYFSVLRSTIFTIVVVAAVTVLVSMLWMPVLRIYGESMTPTLLEGQLVVSVKTGNLQTGDIVALQYSNNKVLVKRYIAGPGDWVDIDYDGMVYVNGAKLDEPYIEEFDLGECDLELPYQVPESRFFVMGDNRVTSLDSRSTAVGCVSEEQIVGKVIFRVWPLSDFGKIT